MPQVDFTLEDVRTMVRTEIKQELRFELDPLKVDMGALKQDVGTLKKNVGMLKEDVDSLKSEVGSLQIGFGGLRSDFDDFQHVVVESFRELNNRMEDGFDEVKTEIRAIRRVTRQHSADSAELRAGQGRS